jgi:hypothetical protein
MTDAELKRLDSISNEELLDMVNFIEWLKIYAPETYQSWQATYNMAKKLVATEPPAGSHSQR